MENAFAQLKQYRIITNTIRQTEEKLRKHGCHVWISVATYVKCQQTLDKKSYSPSIHLTELVLSKVTTKASLIMVRLDEQNSVKHLPNHLLPRTTNMLSKYTHNFFGVIAFIGILFGCSTIADQQQRMVNHCYAYTSNYNSPEFLNCLKSLEWQNAISQSCLRSALVYGGRNTYSYCMSRNLRSF